MLLPVAGRVRLVRVPLESSLTPADALRALRGRPRPFALAGAWAGGGALVGSDPLVVAGPADDPFDLLDAQPEVEQGGVAEGADGGGGEGSVGGGWFGYLGYPLGARLERLPPAPPRRESLPPFSLAFHDHVLRLDPDGRWWFEALWEPGREERLRAALERLRAVMAASPSPPRPYELGAFLGRPGRRGHARAVEWCRRYIAQGDLYQANLCLRLEAPFEGDPIDLFCTAAASLGPDRAAYLGGPWGAVASLSPELFLSRAGRSVLTEPIKGTRPAGSEAERARLLASEKDRAENVMIVDLMRNDLGRSCVYGSVHVPALAQAVAGPGVWHLVSRVAGTLAAGASDADLVRGAFPPGSVTGAPKIKSMEVISELESSARAVYTGAIGFTSPVAGLELSVAIRTFEVAAGRAWLGAGGGITWGSDPEAEYRECLTKARPLIAAAGGSLVEGADEAPPPPPASAVPSRRPRPDPARGVLETILVLDGRVVLPDEHLGRLRASVAALYGERLPPGLALDVPGSGAWRLRVVARPGGDVAVERAQVDATALFPAGPLDLQPLVLPGGLGEHKWADRELVSSVPEPLILDIDGEPLETGSGNLFAIEGDRLVTPAADGRILPGVTRAAVLALAPALGLRVAVGPVRPVVADELFVTSAIRGVRPVGRCEGIGAWRAGPWTRALAEALRARWRASADQRPGAPARG